MKPHYDYIFVTHLPAFYKVNLYHHIAKQCRVLVIFIANGSSLRKQDFLGELHDLDYIILNEGPFEKRNRLKSVVKLLKVLRQVQSRFFVLGGWDLIECWLIALMFAKQHNTLALESSISESPYQGWRGLIKRLFLRRIQTVFASGEPHRALLEALKYQGKILTTGGVGIFHYTKKVILNRAFQGRFLYVGRLSPEKNIERLLAVFRQLPQFSLTIVGHGPLMETLQKACPENVRLAGYIENNQLGDCYSAHDIFILPSLKEPWGLVIEEALYYGLPIVASKNVGCAIDWVEHYQVGALFDPLNNHAIEEAILWVASHYGVLCDQIQQIDFSQRDERQVKQYIEALS